MGNGDGTFQTASNFSASGDPRSVVVADFNADGKQDLAVANGFGYVDVYLGNGNGTFQASVYNYAGNFPYSLVTSDFNLDGKADLAVANQNDNNVMVYLGKGDGTFQPNGDFITGISPRFLTVGDFNGDGVADLATADCGFCGEGLGSVSVLLGYGDGTFEYPAQFQGGSAPFAVVGGDFNNDGRVDLAFANRGDNNVGILIAVPPSDQQDVQ
jgi:hypothetical protein